MKHSVKFHDFQKKKTSSIFFLDGYGTLETYTGFLLSAGGAEVQNMLDFLDSACRVSTSVPCLLNPPLLQKHKQRAFERQALEIDFQDTLELKETRVLFKVLGIGRVYWPGFSYEINCCHHFIL